MAIKEFRDGRIRLTGVHYAKAKKEKWEAQDRTCALCGFYVALEASELDHIKHRGMSGGTRDDRPDNIRILHRHCHFTRHHQEGSGKAVRDKKVII